MKFKTANRIYEVDEAAKQIRQCDGPIREGVQRLTTAWREYASIYVALGNCAVIVWPDSTERLSGRNKGTVPTTITSPVSEIINDEALH